MIIVEVRAQANWTLRVVSADGRTGTFDVSPYLGDEAFGPLRDVNEFMKVSTGGYFVEWACGADLSADTIEARWQVKVRRPSRSKVSKPLQGTVQASRP